MVKLALEGLQNSKRQTKMNKMVNPGLFYIIFGAFQGPEQF